jgi:hypothetical protein
MLRDGSFVSGHARSHPELALLPPPPLRVAELLPVELRRLPAHAVVFASFNAPCVPPCRAHPSLSAWAHGRHDGCNSLASRGRGAFKPGLGRFTVARSVPPMLRPHSIGTPALAGPCHAMAAGLGDCAERTALCRGGTFSVTSHASMPKALRVLCCTCDVHVQL